MTDNKIKILIVDDSAFMRKSLSIMLSSDNDFEIIGTARDGLEGYEMAMKLKPDVITLDIEMPKMDGLTALEKIMKDCPTSVLMVSSLTTEGAEATMKALELGAVDFIPKEMSFVSVNIVKIKDDLIKKIKVIVKEKSLKQRLLRIRNLSGKPTIEVSKTTVKSSVPKLGFKAISLGISTGGPLSLQKVIPLLEKTLNVPMFIVQHMPPKFTKSLADRLNSLSQLTVKEAENNEVVQNGYVYIAPGGLHMVLQRTSSGQIIIKITENPSTTLHKPSVDVTMSSVVDIYGKYTLGIIMTGMGKDGFEAIKKLKELGGFSIAQDENTCVVYGMPKAIVDANLADVIAPLDKIANIINKAI